MASPSFNAPTKDPVSETDDSNLDTPIATHVTVAPTGYTSFNDASTMVTYSPASPIIVTLSMAATANPDEITVTPSMASPGSATVVPFEEIICSSTTTGVAITPATNMSPMPTVVTATPSMAAPFGDEVNPTGVFQDLMLEMNDQIQLAEERLKELTLIIQHIRKMKDVADNIYFKCI